MAFEQPDYSILHINTGSAVEPSAYISAKRPDINEEALNTYWIERLTKHPNEFNGQLLGVKSLTLINNNPVMECFLSDYKTYRYSRHIRKAELCNPITVGNALVTADNKIVIGPRNGDIKTWQLANGFFDPDADTRNGMPDFKHCTQREIAEEICDVDFCGLNYLGIIRKNSGCFISIVYSSRVKQTFAEILTKREKFPPKDAYEMPILKAIDVDENSISHLLKDKDETPLSGTNQAVILLFARHMFGESFYQSHLQLLEVEEKLIPATSGNPKRTANSQISPRS